MKTVNSRQAIEEIANRNEFQNSTGSLKGYWVNNVSELPPRNEDSDIGVYLKDVVDPTFLGISQPAYVITSYGVPIAYVSGRTYTVTNEKWSVTTSKHTSIAQQGLSR